MPGTDETPGETVEAVDTTSEVAAVSEEPAESGPAADADPTGPDTFDWESWDNDHEALPENIRPWAQRFEAHYSKSVVAQRQEAERLRSIYESLMEGKEDPRLAELKKDIETHSVSAREASEQLKAIQSEHQAYKASVEAHFEKEATDAATAFQKANGWIFDNQDLQDLGAELMDKDGFHYNDLPVLLRMPEPLLKETRKLQAEFAQSGAKGMSQHAIQLARSRMKLSDHSTSADLVAGASTPTAAPVENERREGMSFRERQELALDKSLRRLSR